MRYVPAAFATIVLLASSEVSAQPAVPCVYPYPGVLVVMCLDTSTGNPMNVTPEIDTATSKSAIVQASFGGPGREVAFVNLVSLSLKPQNIVVQYAISAADGTVHYWHRRTLGAGERLSIGLHEEAEIFAGRNMSIIGFFSAEAALELTVYRSGDTETEVLAKAGTPQR